jgi:FlaG/FlaF family flagellin (archaellin)
MVAITVVLASVLYVWVMGFTDTSETVTEFAQLEVEIIDKAAGDEIVIKHVGGDKVDWRDYKILINNHSDETQTATMIFIEGELNLSDSITFNATNTPNLDDIDYRFNLYYRMEIYHIQNNKRVYDNNYILCKPFDPHK